MMMIKRLVKAILGWSGAKPNEWFLVLTYVIYIRNRTAVKSLGNITPIEKLTGETPDISIMLIMPYRQPVFYLATGDEEQTTKSAPMDNSFPHSSVHVSLGPRRMDHRQYFPTHQK